MGSVKVNNEITRVRNCFFLKILNWAVTAPPGVVCFKRWLIFIYPVLLEFACARHLAVDGATVFVFSFA